MSIETALKELHPDWSDDDIEEEAERIREDHTPPPPTNMPPPDELAPGEADGTQDPKLRDSSGSRQPGVTGTGTDNGVADGQSPGKTPPRVTAGGSR